MRICWNITGRCNRNCKFCFRNRNSSELSLEDNLDVLDNLIKLDVTKITYAGGEPLLYNGIEKLFKASKDKQIYNKLNTNGSILTKDNIKKYLENIDKVAFSVDSSSDEENYFLGRGACQYNHIKEIVPIIKKQYPKIKIEINTVITAPTINGLDDLFNSLDSTFVNGEISRWKLIRFCPLREMSKRKISQFQITDGEFISVKDKFLDKKASFTINIIGMEEINNKVIINQNGLLEMIKNHKKVCKDLKNINTISKGKYSPTPSDDSYFLNTNLNLYKIFFDVARLGSLSLVSKKMLISQPAISRSIKKLEEELDVALFYRTINGMTLTDKGEELYQYVQDAYSSIKIGERSMMETNNFYKGKLVVGAPSHIASFYLFEKIKQFHQNYPQIEISIISRSTADLIKKLENHEVDFVIDASPIECNEKVICIEKLAEAEHCFVSLKKNNYSKNINSIRDLENYPLILPVAHSSHRKKINDLTINYDTVFKNVISIETSEMVKESILQGLGIGYILREVVKRDIEEGIIEEIKLIEKLPSIIINLVYIEKYLTSVPKLFIQKHLK